MLCCMADNGLTFKAGKLGRALRETRTGLGITLTDFAKQVGIDKGKLSKIETGKLPKPPAEEEVARILGALGVNGDKYDEIMRIAHGAPASQWTATTPSDRELMNSAVIDAEAAALEIVAGALILIPGLAQKLSYARAIMSGGTVPRAEISTRVATRVGRSNVIDPSRTAQPAKYTAIIDEAALRRQVGGPTVMIEQLEYLEQLAAWDNTEIRVVPFKAGWYPGASGAFELIEPRDPSDLPLVYLEDRSSGRLLHADEDVAEYREAVAAGLRAAMKPAESLELIAAVINEMRTG